MATLIIDRDHPDEIAVVVNDDGRIELYGYAVRELHREYLRCLWVNEPYAAFGPFDMEVIDDADEDLLTEVRQTTYHSVDVIDSPYHYAPEYTISYGSKIGSLGDGANSPVLAVSLNGSLVRIVGAFGEVLSWKSYFSTTDGGWGLHLQEEQPLYSFWSRQAMTAAVAVSKEEFKNVVAELLANGGMQTIVTW